MAPAATPTAMQEFQQNGGLTSAIRTAGGERVAQVAQLRLDSLGEIDDFNAVARAEGRRVLRAYLDADFYCTHGPGAGEEALDSILSELLEIVDRVVADELAWAS
jgi:hypothetical protein